jgi:hypothetical protein
MALSTNTYTYAGGAQTFAVNFALGFIQRSDVKVRVNLAVDGSGDPVYTAFTWIDDSAISVTPTLTIGDSVQLERTVSKTALKVNFSNNTDVTPANLDLSAKHGLMVYQELVDGRVDGAESPATAADRATLQADAAAASAAAALISEGLASASADAAVASAASVDIDQGVSTTDSPTFDTVNATTLLGDGSGLTGIVAGLAWVRKTATFTAANNDAIIADTSGGAWALTLPAAPSIGDLVRVFDGADWSTNNLTVARNSSTIEGDAEDLVINIGGVSVDFVYDGTTWQLYIQAGANSGTVVTETDTQTLTNKTLTSPTITGTPTAPTATVGTNTTQVATTAFTKAAIDAATPEDWELIYNTADPAAGTITLIAGKAFSDYRTLCFAGGHDDLLGKHRLKIPVSDFELGDTCLVFSAFISAWRYVRVTHLTDTTFTLAKSAGLYHLGTVWGLK